MSDAKKTGSRDISELKQRLGLKKGAAAQTQQVPTRGNGVVAPPGVNLPPPPGVAPAQPAIPDAAQDPFAAMNAMAAVATVQRAPEKEYVFVNNDGKPVENVHTGSGSLLKIIIPSLVFLGVGVAIGKIGQGASTYNEGIKGVKAMQGLVTQYKKTLSELDTLLDGAKTQKQFRPDKALDTDLEKLALKLDVKEETLALVRNASDGIAAPTMAFFAGVVEVKTTLDQHVKMAKSDDLAFTKAKEKLAKDGTADTSPAPDRLRYAVLMQAPTETDKVDFGAKIVEIGPPYCGDKLAASGSCPEGEQPSGYAYRAEPGGTWTRGDIASPNSDNVPTKKIVLLLPGGVRDSLVKGAEGVASEVYYTKRLRTLYEFVHGKTGPDGKASGGLVDEGNKLETRLQTEASKGTRFSFFM